MFYYGKRGKRYTPWLTIITFHASKISIYYDICQTYGLVDFRIETIFWRIWNQLSKVSVKKFKISILVSIIIDVMWYKNPLFIAILQLTNSWWV